jgi:hypothetical protein
VANKKTMDDLLADRNTRRQLDKQHQTDAEKHAGAMRRLEITKQLANHFSSFNRIKNHLVHSHPAPHPTREVHAVIDLLVNTGLLEMVDKSEYRAPFNPGTENFDYLLKGRWLEEYVYCAQFAAGVDEACYSQELFWKVGEYDGKNEIDVIARRGEKLSLTSCKSRPPMKEAGTKDELSTFLDEVHFWDAHFAGDKGKLLLVTTADLIDEVQNNRHRYPLLAARATIVDVGLLGMEDLRWDLLVKKIDEHWN